MKIIREPTHGDEWLVKGGGQQSSQNIDVGTVAAGQNLKAGTIIAKVDGLLVAANAGNIESICGILSNPVRASAGNVPRCNYFARMCAYDARLVTIPADAREAAFAKLAAMNIRSWQGAYDQHDFG